MVSEDYEKRKRPTHSPQSRTNDAHDHAQDGRELGREDVPGLVGALLLLDNGGVHEGRVQVGQGIAQRG